MRRRQEQEQLQKRLRQWQQTTLPAHREERVGKAFNGADFGSPEFEQSSTNQSDSEKYRLDESSRSAGRPWFKRWRGRLTGAGILGTVAALLITIAVTVPHDVATHHFSAESSAAQSTSATKSAAASKATAGGSQQTSEHSANHLDQSSAPISAPYIPAGIKKVEIRLYSSAQNTANHKSTVQHRVITARGTIQMLRNDVNQLHPAAQGTQGCTQGTAKTANLAFTTNSGQRVLVKVDGDCDLVIVNGVKLQGAGVWTQLKSLMNKTG